MNMMTTPHMNGSAKGMQMLLLRSTVHEFFSSVNWENRPLQPVESQPLLENHTASNAVQTNTTHAPLGLDLTMSVNTFFDVFPWDGKPTIAEPIAADVLPLEEDDDEVTLDDFFGQL